MTDAGVKTAAWIVFLGLMLNGCMQSGTTQAYYDGLFAAQKEG